MNALIIGHSGTLGRSLTPADRMHTQLQIMLREAFPDQEVSVRTEPWRHLNEARLDQLVAEIREQKPDYLILDPVGFWVTMPILKSVMDWHGPALLESGLEKLRRFRASWYTWMLRHAPAPIFCLQNDLVAFIECSLLGAKPLFTVTEAIRAMEILVRSGPAIGVDAGNHVC